MQEVTKKMQDEKKIKWSIFIRFVGIGNDIFINVENMILSALENQQNKEFAFPKLSAME
jgi:hypothetical protein